MRAADWLADGCDGRARYSGGGGRWNHPTHGRCDSDTENTPSLCFLFVCCRAAVVENMLRRVSHVSSSHHQARGRDLTCIVYGMCDVRCVSGMCDVCLRTHAFVRSATLLTPAVRAGTSVFAC